MNEKLSVRDNDDGDDIGDDDGLQKLEILSYVQSSMYSSSHDNDDSDDVD